MSDMGDVERLIAEAESLEYEERLSLIEALLESLRQPKVPATSSIDSIAIDDVFGIWKDRDIDLNSLRRDAWDRS